MVTLFLSLLCPFAFGEDRPEENYPQALEQAQRGEFDLALPRLAELVRRHPENTRFLYDYATVLGWANQDEQALALLPTIERKTAPVYVLESLARSARNLKRSDIAIGLFRDALRQDPSRLPSKIGLGLALAEGGSPGEARLVLDQAEKGNETVPDVLEAQGLAAEMRNDLLSAMVYFQRLLDIAPSHRTGQAGVIRTAARLGAPHLAADLIQRYPGALAQAEIEDILADKTARSIQWGTTHSNLLDSPDRFHELDQAIAQSDATAAKFIAGAQISAPEQHLVLDRVAALAERGRARDAIQLYEQFRQRKIPLPAYVIRAAADSYLSAREPKVARDLYEEVLASDPENLSARTGLFYALVECEQHDRAIKTIDEVASKTPALLSAHDPKLTRPNPRYVSVRIAEASARYYANDLEGALTRLRGLQTRAPHNRALRAALASVYRGRGWSRLAGEELQILEAEDPGDAGNKMQRIGPLMDAFRFGEAQRLLDEGQKRWPDSRPVANALADWRVHQEPEIIITAQDGKSDQGTPVGARDYSVESYIFSSPLLQHYRLFAHLFLAGAEFPAERSHWRRAGGGLEYRGADLRLTGEINEGLNDSGRTGLTLKAGHRFNDLWHAQADFETQSNSIPLQARRAHITARRFGLEVEYRAHESRSIALSAGWLAFSDDNERRNLAGRWRERLFTSPKLKLDGSTGVYASWNSLEGVPYFNPKRDTTLSGTLSADWVTWRRYSRAFSQQLNLTGGRYWQSGYSAHPVWAVEYAHQWRWDHDLYLRYSIGRLLHPYDGDQTGRNYITFDFDWRF